MASIEISKDRQERIDKFVKLGRFASLDDFVQKAVDLMLYAEDNKDAFTKILNED
ncbi:MAG: hypothetical protein J4445_01200 [DPANN group archaeon]|nr:hypothetical protein [DPANN group archaeon]